MSRFEKAKTYLEYNFNQLAAPGGVAALMKRQSQRSGFGKAMVTVLTVSPILRPMTAYASETTAPQAMTNLINIVLSIFRWVGAALFVWGAIQFILAIKRSDADSKADAIQTAMCGIALMMIKTVVQALGITGISNGDLQDNKLDG